MTRLKRWFEGGAVALMQSALLLSFAMSVPLDAEAAPKYAKSEYDCAPNEEYVPWFPWDMTFEKTMLKLMHGYKGECQTPIEIDWAPYQQAACMGAIGGAIAFPVAAILWVGAAPAGVPLATIGAITVYGGGVSGGVVAVTGVVTGSVITAMDDLYGVSASICQ